MRDRESRATEVMLHTLHQDHALGRVLAVQVASEVLQAADAAHWRRWGAGATVLPPDGEFDTVVMRLPRGRRALTSMASLAASRLKEDGKMWIYGANDEGIKSSGKQLRGFFGSVETIDSRRHCRVVEARAPNGGELDLGRWETTWEDQVGDRRLSFTTLPGVFAEGRIDGGTQLLLRSIDVEPEARVMDFGCGGGVIGAALGSRSGEILGLDHDAWAVHCAGRNAPGHYVVSDGWSEIEECFDHVISNPPFHSGKDMNLGLIDGLIQGAHSHLVRGGTLSFVCPATAPVRKALEAAYRTTRLVADTPSFRVWQATT